MKKIFIIFPAFLIFIFASCTKDNATCSTSAKIGTTNAAPTVGDNVTLSVAPDKENTIYTFNGPGVNSSTNSNTLLLSDISYSSRGWYYVTKANSDCNTTLHDSIFIDVKLKQETPPCTPVNNYLAFDNIPSVTLTSVTEGFDPTFNGTALYGNGAPGDPGSFRVLFNSYNGNTEPIDGTYNTTSSLTFDPTDEYNEVSISFLYSSVFYHCHPDQKLYVSHVNGKLRVVMCGMVFSSGTTPFTICSAQLTKM